ncbi:hypothetical protein BC830DRAFT_1121085 [Chytriomyces sp. MP71]|nr:hypothetical protein BC830DRAFT_1121085 [Chytriomyces sp. MP71]
MLRARGFCTTPAARAQFLLVAKDFVDAEAPARRLAVRQRHLDRASAAKLDGHVLVGGATLAADEKTMNGSMLVLEFASFDHAKEWVEADVYVTGRVWQSYSLQPFRMAPLPPKK